MSGFPFAPSRLIDLIASVFAGVLTAIAIDSWHRIERYWLRRRFKRVFGFQVREFYLVLGSLGLNKTAQDCPPAYPKDPTRQLAIKASSVTSHCEIEGGSFISLALLEKSRIRTVVVADEAVKNKLDFDFIAFGAMSNTKTEDMFRNDGNNLAEYSLSKQRFIRKRDQSVLYEPNGAFDHGVILKIHPTQFPNRCWIACAGYGESGTSGAAYFLAQHWTELEGRLKHLPPDTPFLAVIEVERGKDESAKLALFET